MGNTIKIKRGPGAPSSTILEEGELGYDSTNKDLYIGEGDRVQRLNAIKDQFKVLTHEIGQATTKDSAIVDFENITIKLPTGTVGNYYPLGIVGVIADNTSGGSGVSYVKFHDFHLTQQNINEGKVTIQLRSIHAEGKNTYGELSKVRIAIQVLWVRV